MINIGEKFTLWNALLATKMLKTEGTVNLIGEKSSDTKIVKVK